jgi:hypothetical protein
VTSQVLLNLVLGFAYAVLLGLLALSVHGNPELVPHVLVMIFLATGLWASINWFIVNVGLVAPDKQQQELFGQPATGQPLKDAGNTPAAHTAPGASVPGDDKKQQ